MLKRFLLLLPPCAFPIGALAAATIDLTPLPQQYKAEGARRELVAFRTGSVPVLYAPPWKIAGDADSARLEVPEPRSSAEIRRISLTEPLDLQNPEAARKWVIDHLPQDADNVSIEGIERNPVFIDGKPTIEVTVSYGSFGIYRRHRLLLCERSEKQSTDLIVFELAAPAAKFENLFRIFQKSLYSLMGF